ncbi:acyltransferase family protein [Nitrincola sp.]|uniref:acyltransferase family protein n=1 Tax=Nitrincola sp. TaxID=1926584 RepID=UPI003A8E0889
MNTQVSNTIKICRLLCIFFMTYVHVNPGPDSWGSEAPQHLQWIGLIMSDVLGRASVPALSLIGGFLAVSAIRKRPHWLTYTKERFLTLIVPAVSWNIIILVVSLGILFTTQSETAVIREFRSVESYSPWFILDKLTGYNYGSITMAFNFLRDIFVCSLILPVLIPLIKRTGIITLIIIWVAGITIGFSPFIFRPHILMFFSFGIFLYIQFEESATIKNILLKSLSAIAISLIVTYIISLFWPRNIELHSTVLRIIVVISIISFCYLIKKTKLSKMIISIEPISFLLFLSHQTVMLVLWGAWQVFFGKEITDSYTFFYMLSPIFTVTIVLFLYKITQHTPKQLNIAIKGK